MYGSIMGHMGHMRVKCGSNVCQLGRLWVNHGIYWSCGPCMGHVLIMYGSHDSYMGYMLVKMGHSDYIFQMGIAILVNNLS